ncbi:Cellular retinaldehyde binding/alpha-tocopherol transport [Corchorus capsularis]|uniref:Cellular retinaldehyde binding/alpha-tocopherol transport n=1 Tax=Corchorus capsularis TaxID=210143 RepID=A0A1R3JDV4_COCAP|nr:Cellular retinaldehyde binding/alpha-tocopherol transport [Corchorus capsularis]
MESKLENSSEDSQFDKQVQTDTAAAAHDQKEELPKADEEKVIEAEKVKSTGGENGEGKIEGLSKIDMEMKVNDEAKEGDLKETRNEVNASDQERKEDVKKIDEVDVCEVKKELHEEVIKDDDQSKENEVKKEMHEEVIKDGDQGKENEAKAVLEEEKKERVVKIDQTPTIVEDQNNGESNKNDDDEKKKNDVDQGEDASSCNVNVSSLSFKEESNLFSDLKETEKKALIEFRSKVEEAINESQFIIKATKPKENEANSAMEGAEKHKEENGQEDQKSEQKEMKEENVGSINNDIKLWGVPLLPSKGGNATDVVLLKFLRAREFKVFEAFDMLRNTLKWRSENNMDSILDEDLGKDFDPTAFMNGTDRQGHPVCYNVFGVLADDTMYTKTLATEENRDKFVRWRLQLIEKGIDKLDFIGVSSILQITDLKNTPGPSKKEVRLVMKQVISLLQDNYPEFVAKHIFINVPFWYYAFAALLSPFLTQRTKSKFVYARPAKVSETLLKYIDAEEIPISYGGLLRDNDSDFSVEDHAEEIVVKASSTETIEIPTPEAGNVITWDLVVLGWEVNYKEEFVPSNVKSYTILVQKERKMGIQEGSVRNSFKNNEPGKIVLIIDNASKTKKRALYRFKIKSSSSS